MVNKIIYLCTVKGEMPEWSNGPDSKSGDLLHRGSGGSNPSLSAHKI
jgi:hypothetical protein